MQENELIHISNPNKLVWEGFIEGNYPDSHKLGCFVIGGANPKIRIYPIMPSRMWIDVPLFL
jgi:hypothetical protein